MKQAAKQIFSDEGPTRPVMLAVLGLMVVIGVFVIFEREKLANSRYDFQLRREVLQDVFLIRENIQSEIFDRILEMRELATFIRQNPNASDAEFASFVQDYLDEHPEVISIGVAPDLVVQSVFPLKGNEKALGLDYRRNKEQFPKVQQAMETGNGIVTGPVNLVQGGLGLILRKPIFLQTGSAQSQTKEPWGILSMVVDYDAFLSGMGLSEFNSRYDILIREIGAEQYEQQTFFGDPSILERDPEKLLFDFPFGVWELAATTAGGWPSYRPDIFKSIIAEVLLLCGAIALFCYVMHLIEMQRANKRLLFGAIEALPDAFVMFDPRGNLMNCNSKFREMHGKNSDMIKPGISYKDLFASALAQGVVANSAGREKELTKAWMKTRGAGSFDAEITSSNGRVLRVADRVMPDGNIVGLRIDVTELKEAKIAAEAANKAKSDFMAVLSHELRTPLTVMLGMARLSKSVERLPPSKKLAAMIAELPEKHQEQLAAQVVEVNAFTGDMMRKLENSGEHLLFLVNEILDYAKMEASGITLNIERKDLFSIIKASCNQISPMILEKGLSFEVDETTCPVDVDAKRIQQVLLNLLGNAAKFTSAGKISVQTTVHRETVDIVVRDTGMGMPEGELEKIFEPFHQIDASNARGIGGTGLGLAISREIAVAHGGTLTARTMEGAGSTFTLSIKRSATDQEGSQSIAAE